MHLAVIIIAISLSNCDDGFEGKFFAHTGACYNGSVSDIARDQFTDKPTFICSESGDCTCLHGNQCSGKSPPGQVIVSSVTITKHEGAGCTGAGVAVTYDAEGAVAGTRESGIYQQVDPPVPYVICAAICINGVVYEIDIFGTNNVSDCETVPDGDLKLPYWDKAIGNGNVGSVTGYGFLAETCHASYWKAVCTAEDVTLNDQTTVNNEASSSSSSELPTGAIIGIVVGSVAFLTVAYFGVTTYCIKKKGSTLENVLL